VTISDHNRKERSMPTRPRRDDEEDDLPPVLVVTPPTGEPTRAELETEADERQRKLNAVCETTTPQPRSPHCR
jgi:hypothetical protein